jgi:DNA polymerase-3 subunit alpha
MHFFTAISYSYYSLLDGYGSPKKNAKRAKQLGLYALGISDHGSVAGHVDHYTACKKEGIKAIFGVELYVTHEPAPLKANRNNSHMVCWAKNQKGLTNLWKLVSQSYDPNYFYFKPRIQLENYTDSNGKVWLGIEEFAKEGNIIAISGHQGSALADNLFSNLYGVPEQRVAAIRAAYGQKKNVKNSEGFKKFLKPNWLESTCELALRIEKIFGKDNFFIELQNELNPKDQLALWIHPLIIDCLRQVSKETGIMAMASSDPHYSSPDDAKYQRLMVMNNMKESEASVEAKLNSEDDMDVMVFFGSDNFYIHSYDEMAKNFTQEELENTVKIANQVEEIVLGAQPYIPEFKISEFPKDLPYLQQYEKESDKYLMYLCIEGAKKLKPWENTKYSKEDYWKRLTEETETIFKIGLSNYFLVVQDYCKAADHRPANGNFDWESNHKSGGAEDPIPRAKGRGSGAGCLMSYFLGITGVDPLQYGLLFSRFFNAGRMSKDNVSLPDIDIDFAVEDREWVIEYIANKYGKENVCQMITFQTIKGKAAIKDIFRIKDVPGGFDLANDICKYIPDEAMIADDLQSMRESGHDEYGIIQWSLDNSEELRAYYAKPELTEVFDMAIKCEGVKKSQGRHPSAVVITPKPTSDCFPMSIDTKTKEWITGLDMHGAEKLGAAKFDILGTAVLDKLKMAQDLVNHVVPKRNRLKYVENDTE